MASISIISPLDQPLGNRRLIADLKTALNNPDFDNFRIIVAYAKSGPLIRLQDDLEAWRKSKKCLSAIIGLDQQGTSKEALELSLYLFDNVYVTREHGITFHPKIYLFSGKNRAEAFIGSNNLTVGGTEKNFEAAVHLALSLPEDNSSLDVINRAWDELMPKVCPATTLLTPAVLTKLQEDGVVADEAMLRSRGGGSDAAGVGRGHSGPRSGLNVRPESPLPRNKLGSAKAAKAATTVPAPAPAAQPGVARGFAIQIKPHHNGEIFLSVTAALQNPAFFYWPFNGKTVPKKSGNPSYPQLDPDPVVNILVYGAKAAPVLTLAQYGLNTVYYEKKSEIRITVSPLVDVVAEYSIMILEPSDMPDTTWEITIHCPDSPEYESWLKVCNQVMPGGGAQPRRFGWF
jgi:HKD family nuclease